MQNKYQQVMDRIEVDQEMKQRVLANVQKEVGKKNPEKKIVPIRMWRRYAGIAAAAVVVLIGAGVYQNMKVVEEAGKEEVVETANDSIPGDDTGVLISSGFIDAATLQEAEELAGFALEAPESVEGFAEKRISVLDLDTKMIQVIYYNEGTDADVMIRKENFGPDGAMDITGDYNTYSEETTTEVNGQEITIRSENGAAYNAIWNDGEYNYSISASEGISLEFMKELLAQVQ